MLGCARDCSIGSLDSVLWMIGRAPDVVYVGLYRAASTALRAYFDHHPEIVWTRKAGFFRLRNFAELSPYDSSPGSDGNCYIDMLEGLANGHVFTKDVDWGAVGFAIGKPVREAGVEPNPAEIARRIHQVLPNARILLILRNQVDWLRSVYLHHLDRLPESARSFGAFMSTPHGKTVAFAGQFHTSISAYYDLFGPDRVLVLLMEQYVGERQETLDRLCDFLGVARMPAVLPDSSRNEGKDLRDVNLAWLIGPGGKIRLSGLAARALRAAVRPMARRVLPNNVLSPSEEKMIGSFYAASNFHTVRLTGIDLMRYGYPL